MELDLTKSWSQTEVREALRDILVKALGVDVSAMRDDASLIRDLGAESIDFLDISFKAQQLFGVDLPTRLIQDQILEWRSLHVLTSVLEERCGVSIAAEELRMVTPSTIPSMFKYLREKYGLAVKNDGELDLAKDLAVRLVSQMSRLGLDMTGVDIQLMGNQLLENVHSQKVIEEVLNRFTVGALSRYLCDRLAAASRLRDSM